MIAELEMLWIENLRKLNSPQNNFLSRLDDDVGIVGLEETIKE